ncbi:MAG: TetR/AcrR family transcriptional regulator [Proteobacteria bacterium]|nr:TetR/AcrR family transcriptional regulator [Pseudomonadota bacterium]
MNKKTDKNGSLSRSAIRRQREREERYQTILKAAETLFAGEGYHQTSINRIADLSEVSVGTVYFYFKNKEDLLVHLLDEIGFLLRSMVGTEFRKTEASLEGFIRAGRVFFDEFCRKHPEKIVILYREAVGQSPLVTEHLKRLQDKLLADVHGALLRMSENMGFDFPSGNSAEVISVSIMGIYDCIASHYLFTRDSSVDFESIGKHAVDFLIGGIKNVCGV